MAATPPVEAPSKPAIQSTTFRGILVVIVGAIVSQALAHYHVAIPGLSDTITNELVGYLIGGIGLLIAGYGRLTATHKIAGILKTPN